MFSLLHGLWNHVFNKKEFCVLILGVHKDGKTVIHLELIPLLEKLKSINLKGQGLPHDRIGPTVGLNIGCIEDANVKLVFWDLGRQPGLRTIWEKYSHAIVYVIDSSSAQHLKMPNLLLRKCFVTRICKRHHYSYSPTNRIYQQLSEKKNWTDIFTLKSLTRGHVCLWRDLHMMGRGSNWVSTGW
ncbi:hypothetical protein VPH35_035828 [Triticum aestivum]